MPDASGPSEAFDLLHERVRRWIWREGWSELRDIQEQAIPILSRGDCDLIISAATASGKTEAAFLPIVSAIASNGSPRGSGFEAMYIGPLRALINDQFRRVDSLCEDAEIAVWKWHGDVAATAKGRARKNPSGILLITPESLEAILVRHGGEAPRLFGALRYVVIDELHAFLGNERGRHLQSLLHRTELASRRRAARVGLSATLAEMESAKSFLRPLNASGVAELRSSSSPSVRVGVHGFLQPARSPTPSERGDPAEEEQKDPALLAIARDLFERFRGRRGLVFADHREQVEELTAALLELCETRGVPEEFFAHHGKLSRELREDAEQRLRDEDKPGTIIATSTLELGIDVGQIDEVAQLDPGRTVAGLRQRLGRSGRRKGLASSIRIYIKERELDERSSVVQALRTATVQSVAMVELMRRGWNEPPVAGRLHLSALAHQVLALILQHGGITAEQGWTILMDSGVFPVVDQGLFVQLLRRLGDPKVRVIEQAPDGTLLLGEEGERATASYDFYPVFAASIDYKVVTVGNKQLGLLAPMHPIQVDSLIIVAGRRWRIAEVDIKRHEVLVTPAYGGRPARGGSPGDPPHDDVVAEMRRVWMSSEVPEYLDSQAAALLKEGRQTFRRLALDRHSACLHDGTLVLFPWLGDRALRAFALALRAHDVDASHYGIVIETPAKSGLALQAALTDLAAQAAPDGLELAERVADLRLAKYDGYLDRALLRRSYASERLDTAPIPAVARQILRALPAEH